MKLNYCLLTLPVSMLMAFSPAIADMTKRAPVQSQEIQRISAKSNQLELFGLPLKGASREQLRQALKQNGMRAKREENNYWIDLYDPKGVLDGATRFSVGYVSRTGQFAFAEYSFEAFMDTGLVEKVINLVASKYGRPTSLKGNYGLGSVNAKWIMGQGMQIEVSRGWPDTTTFMRFIDSNAYQQMQSEIDSEKNAQTQKRAKEQSKAF